MCEFSPFTKLSVLFPQQGDPAGDCSSLQARSDQQNSLDLNPSMRKLAFVGLETFLIKFSSLSTPTKIEELTAGSDEKTLLSLWELNERRFWLGMIPTRASLRLNGFKSSEFSLVAACLLTRAIRFTSYWKKNWQLGKRWKLTRSSCCGFVAQW